MKINNSTIITFFIIYVSCLYKSINVEISFLISNLYVTEGICEQKFFENYLHARETWSRKSAQFYGGAIFLAGNVYMQHPARTYRMETWTWVFSMDMDIQHEHVAQKWTCDMDMDM